MSKLQLRNLYRQNIRPAIKAVASTVRGIQYRIDMRLETLLNGGLSSAAATGVLRKAMVHSGWDSDTESVTYTNRAEFESMLAFMTASLPQRERANGAAPSPKDYISYAPIVSAKPPKGESTVYITGTESIGTTGYKNNIKVRMPRFGLTTADQQHIVNNIMANIAGASSTFDTSVAAEYLISTWLTGNPNSKVKRSTVQFNESALFSKGKIQKAYLSPMRDDKGRFTSEFSILKRLLLGTSLHDIVKKNMGVKGRLVYRTGRLARSAKVSSVSKEGKNDIRIKYSYMRFPYDVFENHGSPLYKDGARKPTKLISTSIRELARQVTTDRFNLLVTRS